MGLVPSPTSSLWIRTPVALLSSVVPLFRISARPIRLSVSSFSPTTTGVSGSSTRTKRQVQTTVTVDDGELLVIGGLNSDKAADSSSGFSFLPKAWAAHSRSRSNTDLVLILSATVVR